MDLEQKCKNCKWYFSCGSSIRKGRRKYSEQGCELRLYNLETWELTEKGYTEAKDEMYWSPHYHVLKKKEEILKNE